MFFYSIFEYLVLTLFWVQLQLSSVFGSKAQLMMEALKAACTNALSRVRLNPPAMDPYWPDEVKHQLATAAAAALDAGAEPSQVYLQLLATAERAVGDLPDSVIKACLEHGLSLDTRLHHNYTLLHTLFNQEYPPFAGQLPENANVSPDLLTVDKLMALRPTPDLGDNDGHTVLHMVAKHVLTKHYFPDPEPEAAFYTDSNYLYNDEQRAEYLRNAFPKLVDAGFSVHAKNVMGVSVLSYLKMGKHFVDDEINKISGGRTPSGASIRSMVGRMASENFMSGFFIQRARQLQAVADAFDELIQRYDTTA